MPQPHHSSIAQQRLELRFINATNEVAQHPSAGVAMVGATAMLYISKGRLSAQQVFDFADKDKLPEPAVAVTSATHALVGAYGIPRERLRGSVAFAHGLVGHGLVSTAVEIDKFAAGEVLPTLEVATAAQQRHFAEIAENPMRAGRVGEILSDVNNALTDISNTDVQDAIDGYHSTILDVSRHYAGSDDVAGRMGELGQARDSLADGLRPTVIAALVRHTVGIGAEITAHNILRHNPGPQLLNHYLGVPLPGQPPAPQA